MKKFIFILLIIIFVACSGKDKGDSKKGLAVEGLLIKKKIIEESIYSVGTISQIEKVEVSSKVTGRLEKIYVDVGSIVRRGTLLMQIEKFPLELEMRKAQADYEQASSALQLTEAKYKDALKRVQQQLKVIEKAKADLAEKEVALENIRKINERKVKLFEIGAITLEEKETMATELKSYETRFELSKRELEIQMNGYRDEDIEKNGYKVPEDLNEKNRILEEINTKVEKAEVNVQKANLKNAEASMASIKLLLEKTTIYSPMNGVVAVRNIEPGEAIVQDSPLIVIINIDSVYAILNVPETKVNQIKRDNRIEMKVDAIPDQVFKGFIYLISPIIDLKTRTVEVRGKFTNPAYHLKPGMFSRASIFTGKKRESIIIPNKAIVTSQTNTADIFVVMNGKEAYSRKVEFREELDNKIEVLSGLKPDETVIISNVDQLNDGSLVEVNYVKGD